MLEYLSNVKHTSLFLPQLQLQRKKSFITLTTGVNSIKLFFFVVFMLNAFADKLEKATQHQTH